MELGLDLNFPHRYLSSSMRYFNENERHVSRIPTFNVLLIVFKGVLKFSEDGEKVEVRPGEYYIQRHSMAQAGPDPSDMPEYFYIEFLGEWTDKNPYLKKRGKFSEHDIIPFVKQMEKAVGGGMPTVVKTGIFYNVLSKLYEARPMSKGAKIAEKMAENMSLKIKDNVKLEDFCQKYNYGKNHLIKVFKDTYGVTPISYLEQLRLNKAKLLLLNTDATMENIATECGFSDYSHMYKTFLRLEGITPGKYKTQHFK